jgi:hypothetical protein
MAITFQNSQKLRPAQSRTSKDLVGATLVGRLSVFDAVATSIRSCIGWAINPRNEVALKSFASAWSIAHGAIDPNRDRQQHLAHEGSGGIVMPYPNGRSQAVS